MSNFLSSNLVSVRLILTQTVLIQSDHIIYVFRLQLKKKKISKCFILIFMKLTFCYFEVIGFKTFRILFEWRRNSHSISPQFECFIQWKNNWKVFCICRLLFKNAIVNHRYCLSMSKGQWCIFNSKIKVKLKVKKLNVAYTTCV